MTDFDRCLDKVKSLPCSVSDHALHSSSIHPIFKSLLEPYNYVFCHSKGMETIVNAASTLFHLFFAKKFTSHRLLGLFFLIQFFAASYLCCFEYEYFARSWLWWSMPLTGVVQSLNAVATFTFLPKKQVDPGYYSDKSMMSYRFIYENIFYESILAFQWIYMNNDVYMWLLAHPYFGGAMEALWVFLPYTAIREPFFPKTHFRDSLNNKTNKTDKNQQFYDVLTKLTSVFYLFAMHYIGYMLNYMRFMNCCELLVHGGVMGWYASRDFLVTTVVIALIGLLLNRYNNPVFHVYQVLLTVWFFNLRYHWFETPFIGNLGL